MDDRMERRAPWIPWAVTSVMLVVVALVAYTFGAHQEVVRVGAEPAERVWAYNPFGGIWALFFLFWIFGGLRWMFWGGYRRPWGYRRYYHPSWHDDRDEWEDWHRREHERMNTRGSGTSRSETSQGPI